MNPARRLVVRLALVELELRLKAAHVCFRAANAIGRVGSLVSGSTYVSLAAAAAAGSEQVELSYKPTRFVRGLRIEGETSMEIVRVRRIDGARITIDRPLAEAYPQGSKVKVLV